MSKNLLLTVSQLGHGNNASSKPRDDIEYFLHKKNFLIKNLHIDINSKLQKAIYRYWKLDYQFKPYLANKKPANIFIQYPAYSRILMDKVISIIRQILPNTKIFFIIHDVESLRMYKNKENYPATEIALFNNVDGLIAHNQNMKQWLVNHGVNNHIEELKLFDYKSNIKPHEQNKYKQTVCFAGNLKKSQFINYLNKVNVKINVFGNGLDLNNNANVIYQGSKTPDELPKFLNYNFGLIWDGNTIDTCSGKYGEYLKYNSPHKASLYLSAGLPLIVWSKSALANFVKENNIGIVVDSLNNLDKTLSAISEKKYLTMANNTLSIAQKLHEGYFIEQATTKITTK